MPKIILPIMAGMPRGFSVLRNGRPPFCAMQPVGSPGEPFLCSSSHRRLGLVDIERIAPLEEGALPYNLAEVQKQVKIFQRYGVLSRGVVCSSVLS